MFSKNNHIVIVIPTYNEKINIKELIESILKEQENLPTSYISVLVVDDSSPDGTEYTVNKLKDRYDNIHILAKGKKEGIGSAYIRGFTYAITQLKADIIFEMDADYSHNPKDIPRLYKEILKDNDFVIGSRYITGSSISRDWPLKRLINSKCCNFFARYIAGLKSVHDCTSGFRAIKKDILVNIDLGRLKAKSYSFQMVLLFHATKKEARVKEIPINFQNRKNGTSKMFINDTIEFFIHALKLKFVGKI